MKRGGEGGGEGGEGTGVEGLLGEKKRTEPHITDGAGRKVRWNCQGLAALRRRLAWTRPLR